MENEIIIEAFTNYKPKKNNRPKWLDDWLKERDKKGLNNDRKWEI